MLLQNWKMIGMKKINCWRWGLLTVLEQPLGVLWSPTGWAGMFWGAPGWWSLFPRHCCSHDSAACLEVPPHSPLSLWRNNDCSLWQARMWPQGTGQGPVCHHLGSSKPSHPLTSWFNSPDSFFFSLSVSSGEKKIKLNNLLAPSSSSHPTSPGAITDWIEDKMLQKVIFHFDWSIFSPLLLKGLFICLGWACK